MFRVEVSCWYWRQARFIRDRLPQFTPTIEDWYPETEPECDLLDQILSADSEPMIYMFFDVETEQDTFSIRAAAAIAPRILASLTPVVLVQGD